MSFLTTTYTLPHPSPPSSSSYTPRPTHSYFSFPLLVTMTIGSVEMVLHVFILDLHTVSSPFLHPLPFILTYYIPLLAMEVYSNVFFFSLPPLNVCIHAGRKRALGCAIYMALKVPNESSCNFTNAFFHFNHCGFSELLFRGVRH